MPSYNEIDGVPSTGKPVSPAASCVREWEFRASSSPTTTPSSSSPIGTGSRHAGRAAVLALAPASISSFPTVKRNLTLWSTRSARAVSMSGSSIAPSRACCRLKFLAGLFEHPYADPDEAERVDEYGRCAGGRPRRRQGIVGPAEESTAVGCRWIARIVHTLAVVGPNAADPHFGGYSEGPRPRHEHFARGIKSTRRGPWKIVYAEGCRITEGAGRSGTVTRLRLADPAKNRATDQRKRSQ